LDLLQDIKLKHSPRFIELAWRLTARYPGITSPEAQGRATAQLAWTDGPLAVRIPMPSTVSP
jgi:hypothetical protein